MDSLLVLKGKLQKFYAQYSKYIDKGVQLIVALLTFFMINKDLGFMEMLSNPVISLGLAIICAFLPPAAMALFAVGLICAHLFTVSMGMMIAVAIIFLMMFIFYVRFTPKMAMIIILTVLAFTFKIPYVIPVVCGLLATPITSVPTGFGVITYFMLDYVKDAAAELKESEEVSLIGDIGECAKGVFQNKEMWVTVIAFIICVLVVYNIRRMSMAHPWKVAIVAGTLVNIVFIAAGGAAFGVHVSMGTLLGGSVVSVIIGFVLEIVFFNVDYSRSERLQYEDDEYYYYVKAVPKITVGTSAKSVKKITAREDLSDETQIIDDGEGRTAKSKTGKKRKKARNEEPVIEERGGTRPNARKRAPKAKSSDVPSNTEHLLLTQSLEKELNLNKKKR